MRSHATRSERWAWAAGVAAAHGLIFVLDLWSGPYFSSQVLYLLPISVAGWRLGRRAAYASGLLASAAYFCLDIETFPRGAPPLVLGWAAFSTLVVFPLTGEIVSRHRANDQRTRVDD